MNEAFQARAGLPPDLFPNTIPTFTGHYHKPHTVSNTSIRYVGSPYQSENAGHFSCPQHGHCADCRSLTVATCCSLKERGWPAEAPVGAGQQLAGT